MDMKTRVFGFILLSVLGAFTFGFFAVRPFTENFVVELAAVSFFSIPWMAFCAWIFDSEPY